MVLSTPLAIQRYQCKTSLSGLKFPVPSYLLKALPAGTGSTIVQNDIFFPLPAMPLDISNSLASVFYEVDTTYTAAK